MRRRTTANVEFEQITGTIIRVREAVAGFFIGTVDVDGDQVAFCGGSLFVQVGYKATLVGNWNDHPKYGRQFKTKQINYETLELSVDGLEILLAKMGEARGIGPVRAHKLVDHFGVDFESALETRRDEVATVAGVKIEMIDSLAAHWAQHRSMLSAYAGLLSLGFDMRQAQAVYEDWGNESVARVRENPYATTKIDGVGFATADSVAAGLGVAKDDPARVRAGVMYEFDETIIGAGSTCCGIDELQKAAAKRLSVSTTLIERAIFDLVEDRELTQHESLYTTPQLHTYETFIAGFLHDLHGPNQHTAGVDLDALVTRHYQGLTPDADQFDAVKLGLTHRGCLITGGAGAGKTTILRVLLNCYRELGKRIGLAAPTGKAAKRMEQATGREALTIHRLLEYHPELGWRRNKNQPLEYDVVFIDESSMLGTDLAWRLMQAIPPHCCLVLVGDHHQLPPVSPGAVLRDCTENTILPTKVLGHCHRQAGTLRRNCAAVLSGSVAATEKPYWLIGDNFNDPNLAAEKIVELYTTYVPEKLGLDPQKQAQVIVPQNKDNPLATRRLNVMLQKAYHEKRGVNVPDWGEGKPGFVSGDRVIQMKNDYNLGVMNGHQGICLRAPRNGYNGPGMVIHWEGFDEPVEIPSECVGNVALSYALTCHKAQGSEWPVIILAVHSTNWFMLHRQWLYTAVTRAREYLLVVGNDKGVNDAARKVDATRRKTLLPVLRGELMAN